PGSHHPCHYHTIQNCGQPHHHHLPRGSEHDGPGRGQGGGVLGPGGQGESWELPLLHSQLSGLKPVCRVLRNFSSLLGILSALQSPSIHHLKKIWGQVSRWIGHSPSEYHQSGPDMAHTAAVAPSVTWDHLGDSKPQAQGLTWKNSPKFKKWYTKDQWQYNVIEDIPLLQKAANQYNLQPKERFGAWFQAVEPLIEDERCSLSCQLELPFQWTSKTRMFFKAKRSPPPSSAGL
ncbi:hypothetical protein HPG69_010265, partial [Diceros bicornis minor]